MSFNLFRFLFSKSKRSCTSKALSKESIGSSCTNSFNSDNFTPPTWLVGESDTSKKECFDSSSLSFLKRRSYSLSLISGASST